MFQRFQSALSITTICILGFLIFLNGPAFSQNKNSGLSLPRFVSLRADVVNMRTGPGVQYPVEWVFKRHGLPVEIISEYDTWRKVRDWQGTQGWIHQSMLNGKRKFIVVGSERTVRHSARTNSAARAILELGVIGKIIECEKSSSWCKIEVDSITGWLRRVDVWGIYKGEEVK